MANLTEKQGYLGDLTLKSTEELRDLLRRQETVAANSKFMGRLPDKGGKIHQMILRIEVALKQQEDIDQTANLFQNMAINSEQARRQRAPPSEDTEEEALLRRLANRDEENKVVSSVETEDVPSSRYVNSYEKVMKQAEKRKSPRGKFLPNRTIKATDIQELSGKLKAMTVKKDVVTLEPEPSVSVSGDQASEGSRLSSDPATSNTTTHAEGDKNNSSTSSSVIGSPNGVQPKTPKSDTTNVGHGRLKHKYDELLEEKLYSGEAHCAQAKTISVEESFQLQLKQKHMIENIQAKQAADKLSQRLNVKMSGFKPSDVEGSKFTNRYRDADTVSDDADSDDEEDELDYPD